MLSITKKNASHVEMRATGTLTREDYERVMPQIEREASGGPIRLLVELDHFDGWTPKAFVEDVRFDVKHRTAFERVAVVGDKELEKLGTELSAAFFAGDVRWFDDAEQARRWIDA